MKPEDAGLKVYHGWEAPNSKFNCTVAQGRRRRSHGIGFSIPALRKLFHLNFLSWI